MNTTRRRVGLAVAAAALTTAVVPGIAAGAGDHDRAGGEIRTTITVLAEGLDVPRGIVYDRSRERLLIAESGNAAENNGACGTGNGGAVYCYGESAAIYQYNLDTNRGRRIHEGLPSTRTQDGSAVIGFSDLTLHRGEITLVFGLSGNRAYRDSLIRAGHPGARHLATVARFNRAGSLVTFGDTSTFEEIFNPDGRRVDSNPFGIYTDQDGTIVADAGANTVLKVADDGEVSLLAYLPPRTYGADTDYESVPTAVSRGPDGNYYVTELTGYPTHKGSARVLRITPAGEVSVAYEGFTNIVDATWDNYGRLVVLEIAKESVYGSTDPTGRLVRVEPNGTHTDLATTGLHYPGGVAFAGNGTYYVTNRSFSGGGDGQLLKVRVQG